jgi:WhiB family transcriptional regulator, redox-sensing transcriptional regulator
MGKLKTVTERPTKNELPWWPDWVTEAECRKYDPNMFFDFGTGDARRKKVNDAKKICWSCPVIRECLLQNLDVPYGMFAGLMPRDRWRLVRHKRSLHQARSGYWNYDDPDNPEKNVRIIRHGRIRSATEELMSLQVENGVSFSGTPESAE